MRTVRILLVLAAAVVLTAACSSAGSDAGAGTGDASADGTGDGAAGGALDLTGSWRLDEGDGPGGEVEIIPTARVTMEVDAQSGVTGSASCNRYSGTVVVDGSSVRFGPIATTRMACAPRPGAAEAAYLAALDDVDAGARTGDELTLTGPDTRLVFTRQG